MSKGWIKLKRSFIDWEWYSDHNASRLLIHLLCSVNYESKKWQGITIPPGSIVLSWHTLSESIGLTPRQCRTAMNKLETSGEVTRKTTNRYQVVSLVKWDKIQINGTSVDSQEVRQKSGRSQADDRQMTTTKESKEYKEIKKRERFTPPLPEIVDEYFLEKGLGFEESKSESEKFVNYYQSKGWMVGKNKMKQWKGAAANWIKRHQEYKKEKSSGKKENEMLTQKMRREYGLG